MAIRMGKGRPMGIKGPPPKMDVNGNPLPPETLEAKIRRNLENSKEQVRILEEYLALVIKIPLKEGDFCFHKEHGKALIKHLSPGENVGYSQLTDVGVAEALIVTINGEKKVKYADIVPFSEMTEVLYEPENSN